VAAGQELFLPKLTVKSLARRQSDGSYRLIVSAFLSRSEADEFARRVEKEGYSMRITATRVANDLLLHRVEVVDLKSVDDAARTLQAAVKRGWLAE
jgi:hypothetical protein